MHYYQRNVGDYAKDAGHLTALEHGIYTLLIDWYYANERPIPADNAARIARVKQKDAEAVLCEFFSYDADLRIYRHRRCDAEIEKYRDFIAKEKVSGKKGAEARSKQAPRVP